MAVAAQPVPDKALEVAPAWQYSVTLKGMKGAPMQAMAAQAIRYVNEVTSPRDRASGQASGKRMHKPFVITKELDAASPRQNLRLAHAGGEIREDVIDGDAEAANTRLAASFARLDRDVFAVVHGWRVGQPIAGNKTPRQEFGALLREWLQCNHIPPGRPS